MGLTYRLRGEVGGVERSYPVPEAGARVGCVGSNDIVVPVRGVSRAHCRIAWAPEGLVVEDLDSRNGVFLNGARVRRATLHAGDALRLGPVSFRVEEAPAEVAELAIRVADGPSPAGLPSWEPRPRARPPRPRPRGVSPSPSST
jgi:predicted component of type VI protein secretion system